LSSAPRLLVVDDDKMIRTYLRGAAEGLGYEVVTAGETEEFRQLFRSVQPDVVLLDLVIPGTDGIEMLKFLAAAHCKVPVVLMSGLDERAIHAAQRLGAAHGLRMFGGLEKPFDREMLETVLKRCGLERRNVAGGNLLEAIDRGELRLHYQPQVAPLYRWALGVEALLRWEHPEYGLLMPAYFLPMAEKSDVICSVTRWVCSEALTQLTRWKREGHDLTLSINLSARDIKDGSFPCWLEEQVRSQDLDPSRIILELTEHEAMSDIDQALELLTRLRLKGFQLSIDDFGTGYSSLAMLQQVPFCELKIDKCFVMQSGVDPEARIIVKSVVNLGHTLGLRVVAEGVEEEEIFVRMRDLEVDVIQGYHTGRPMSAEALGKWLAKEPMAARRTA